MKFVLSVITLLLACMCFAQPATLWTVRFPSENHETANWACELDDGGFFIAGNSETPESFYNVFRLLRMDSLGDTLWTRSYDFGQSAELFNATSSPDGGVVLMGYRSTDIRRIFAAKVDPHGDTLWTREYGVPDVPYHTGFAIRQANNNGYFIVGDRNTSNGPGVYVVRIDQSGDTLWTSTITPGWTSVSKAYDILPQQDGGGVVVGTTHDFSIPLQDHIYLIRLDSSGDTLWTRIVGSAQDEIAYSVCEGENEGFVIAGHGENEFNTVMYIQSFDSSGFPIWETEYGSDFAEYEADQIVRMNDGGYLVCGTKVQFPDFLAVLLRIDSSGDSLWSHEYGQPYEFAAGKVVVCEDGSYFLAGSVFSNQTLNDDVYLVKTEADIASINNRLVNIPQSVQLYQNYPNPFNPTTTISFDLTHYGMVKLNVFDVIGRQVSMLVDGNVAVGSHQVMFDGAGLVSGVYFVRLEVGSQVMTRKMVLMK